MQWINLSVIVTLLLIFAGCENYPKDPHNTLEKIKGDTIRVGIAESGQWASYKDHSAQGLEAEIIKTYAQQINATIKWIPGAQEDLINLMKKYEIDIAIGGFTNSSVFKKHAALTQPFYTEKIKVGAPASFPIPEEIEDQEVLVKEGSAALLAALAAEAKPVKYDSLNNSIAQLIVAPEYELEQMGLQVSKYDLKKIEHVLAIPKGENGFLADLDKYIQKYVKGK